MLKSFKLKLKRNNIKLGYFVFVGCTLLGFINMVTHGILTRNGKPTSTNSVMVHDCNIVITLIATFAPLLALYILLKKEPSKILGSTFWILMIAGQALTLVVMVRSTIWMVSPLKSKQQEIKDYIYLTEKEKTTSSSLTIFMSRRYECCGVKSYQDWGEMYKEIDQVRSGIQRPRKVPDFCCKIPKIGCGNRYVNKVFDELQDVLSGCGNSDPDKSKLCLDASNILDYKLDRKVPLPLDDFAFLVKKNDTIKMNASLKIITVSDPRIDIATHKKSLGLLPRVVEVCDSIKKDSPTNLNPSATYETQVMVYYQGWAKTAVSKDKIKMGIGNSTYSPCLVKNSNDKTISECKEIVIPVSHFVHIFGFCRWLKSTVDSTTFGEEESVDILTEAGEVYAKGCYPYQIKYIDTFIGSCLTFSVPLLILFITMMFFYNKYYFDFLEDQLREAPMPRWYEPLPNEKPRMLSFGDVDFIPDGNCTKLIPCAPRNVFGKFPGVSNYHHEDSKSDDSINS